MQAETYHPHSNPKNSLIQIQSTHYPQSSTHQQDLRQSYQPNNILTRHKSAEFIKMGDSLMNHLTEDDKGNVTQRDIQDKKEYKKINNQQISNYNINKQNINIKQTNDKKHKISFKQKDHVQNNQVLSNFSHLSPIQQSKLQYQQVSQPFGVNKINENKLASQVVHRTHQVAHGTHQFSHGTHQVVHDTYQCIPMHRYGLSQSRQQNILSNKVNQANDSIKFSELEQVTPLTHQKIYIHPTPIQIKQQIRPAYKKIHNQTNEYYRTLAPQYDYYKEEKGICSKILPLLGVIMLLFAFLSIAAGLAYLAGLGNFNTFSDSSQLTTNTNINDNTNNNSNNNQQMVISNDKNSVLKNNFVSNDIQNGVILNQNKVISKQDSSINKTASGLTQVDSTAQISTLFASGMNQNGYIKTTKTTSSSQEPNFQSTNSTIQGQQLLQLNESQTSKLISKIIEQNNEIIPQNFKVTLNNQINAEVQEVIPQNFRTIDTVQEFVYHKLQQYAIDKHQNLNIVKIQHLKTNL